MCSTNGSGTLWTSGTDVIYVNLLADPRRPTGTADTKSNETPIIRRKFVN